MSNAGSSRATVPVLSISSVETTYCPSSSSRNVSRVLVIDFCAKDSHNAPAPFLHLQLPLMPSLPVILVILLVPELVLFIYC